MHRADLLELVTVSEAHYSDLYGQAMRRFHDKYKNAGPDLWVNFNPVLDDPRDKTIVGLQMDKTAMKASNDVHTRVQDWKSPIFKQPDHGDPVGTYVYPAEYVANHWFDIQYGDDMQYLRVIKAKELPPEKILRFNDMTEQEFYAAAKRLHLEWHVPGDGIYSMTNPKSARIIFDAILHDLLQTSPHYRVNRFGKVLFAMVQRSFKFKVNPSEYLSDEPAEDDDENYFSNLDDREAAEQNSASGYLITIPHDEKNRTQQQQNRILVSAGYDMVIDLAKTPLQATIFHAEPEQAIFLTKRAYDVVEVYKLPPNRVANQTQEMVRLPKIFAGMLAKGIGDGIAEIIPLGVIDFEFNIERFRRWLRTDKLELAKMDPRDPTQPVANYTINGFTTMKGRLIITAVDEGRESDVESGKSFDEMANDIKTAHVRGEENEAEAREKLRGYALSQMMDKRHREKLDYTQYSLRFAIVGGPNQVVYGDTGYDTRLPQAASAVAAEFKAQKPGGMRITAATVGRYKNEVETTPINSYYKPPKKQKPVAPKPEPAQSNLGNLADLPEAP